jgi:glycyl-tRNA synthetase beta chain
VPEFLLEIGFEEMPSAWLPGLTDQLRDRFTEAAIRESLEPGEVQAFETPRRLVLRADLLARQPDRVEVIWGPAKKVAKDSGGNWTKAAEGFAKKWGIRPEDLQTGGRGAPGIVGGMPAGGLTSTSEEYVFHSRPVPGQGAAAVMPGIISEVLRALNFPKRMNWDAWLDDGKGAFPFGRPIRWIVALLEGVVLPFTIYEAANGGKGRAIVESSNTTRGHRLLHKPESAQDVRINSFVDLQEQLRRRSVLLSREERIDRIEHELTSVIGDREIKGAPYLQKQWADLVEHPSVVAGLIPADFQQLPLEVVATVLVHHQKYIPIGARGSGVSGFAAVTDSDGRSAGSIARGMERVVMARLRDAAFFWAEDMKHPLADRVAELAGVTFHQGLGNYREKTERLVKLVHVMGGQLGYLTKPELQAAQDAAQLAKADLTTLMVREFPELQGAMGGIYLRAQGHPWPNVASAVYWHYHPLSIEEGSPPAGHLAGSDATIFGAVSLADKLDTLAGYFGLGLVPTGSSDPFGLRRAGQGAVRVLLDFWHADAAERRPSLTALVGAAVTGYAGVFKRQQTEVVQDLEGFLLNRLEYVLVARGFPAEEVAAVLYTPTVSALEDPHDCLVRLKALHRGRAEAQEDFEHLAVAFKRAKNILTQEAGSPVIEPGLFESDAERELHGAVTRLADADGGYEARLRALAGLRAPVDRFFDDVLVMAEDPKVRANRLALLHQALSLFYRIADISRLGG